MMKLSEIHNGLENQNVREMLAERLSYLNHNRPDKTVAIYDSNEDTIDWVVKNEEAEIEWHTQLLKSAKAKQACRMLITFMGWNEYDISEYVIFDLPEWINFIGSESEYQELLTKLKK